MFGYITPLKMELKVKEFDYFKSYYHGLCYALKDNFGNIPRLTLNYDMTFISFILDGLSDEQIYINNKRCIKHPTYDIQVTNETKALKYGATLSLIFFSYKLEDNIKDENSVKSKLFNIFLNPYSVKALDKNKNISNIIKNNLNELSNLESKKTFEFLDEIVHPFADTMGLILKLYDDNLVNDSTELRNDLYSLGYAIGRYIYIMDAFDDIEDDLIKMQFNPLIILHNLTSDNINEKLESLMLEVDYTIISCISKCKELIEKISFVKHKEILNNIIQLGMPNKYYEICNKKIPPVK